MTIAKTKINESDRDDMLAMLDRMDTEAFTKLINMVNDIDICPYRFRRALHFGSSCKMECVHRVWFRADVLKHLTTR